MRNFIIILLTMSCSIVYGQDDWRDSLKVAREAYKNQDYGKALKYYESAQRKAPEDINLSDEMGQSAYKAREFEKAEKIYQQNSSAETGSTTADKYHNLGNARMKQKNYQGAVDAYKEALRANPNDDATRYNLSEAIRNLKNQQKQQQQNQQNQNQQNQNQNQQNQGQNQQQGQNGQQQQQNQGQQQQGQNGQPQNQQGDPQSGNGEPQEQGKGQLPNQTVERELDKLAKKEAETKRRLNGAGKAGKPSKSGKDW